MFHRAGIMYETSWDVSKWKETLITSRNVVREKFTENFGARWWRCHVDSRRWNWLLWRDPKWIQICFGVERADCFETVCDKQKVILWFNCEAFYWLADFWWLWEDRWRFVFSLTVKLWQDFFWNWLGWFHFPCVFNLIVELQGPRLLFHIQPFQAGFYSECFIFCLFWLVWKRHLASWLKMFHIHLFQTLTKYFHFSFVSTEFCSEFNMTSNWIQHESNVPNKDIKFFKNLSASTISSQQIMECKLKLLNIFQTHSRWLHLLSPFTRAC